MEINTAINKYLEWKGSHTTVAYDRYKVRLDHFYKYITQFKTTLAEINGDDIVAYHKTMEQDYSPSTIAFSARILKNFFSFWHGRREVHFSSKEIIPMRFISADREIVTPEDFEDMMDALSMEDTYDELMKKLVVSLLWDTGMRVSELCEMTLESISSVGENGMRSAKVRSRKSMRYNRVVWSRRTDEILTQFLGIRVCLDINSDILLIGKRLMKPITIRSIQRWMKEICDLAMIDKPITPHSFRHGKAHAMLDQGANVRDVQAVLRHVKPESSFHYMQLSQTKFLSIAGKYLAV